MIVTSHIRVDDDDDKSLIVLFNGWMTDRYLGRIWQSAVRERERVANPKKIYEWSSFSMTPFKYENENFLIRTIWSW